MHSKNLVHGDIATRSCWLDDHLQLKLGDSALSRDLFPDDYGCLDESREKLPLAWMAYETLTESARPNAKSDIWAIGVTVWESFTLCKQPYEGVVEDAARLAEYLGQGDGETSRLPLPERCEPDLFAVCIKCWSMVPQSRPSLKELFNSMHKFYNNLNNYV